ncbi:DUF58 domain-containing protein [Marinobacterium aestuariivivens]|uniref:DUF58 domain-containing protein n=1 Tax=Marinobacterium aestuariivivens TaxID=1698799 RepID=A0ABW2A0D8_9GAMM
MSGRADTAAWWHSPGPWLGLLALGILLAAWNQGIAQLYQLGVLLLATLVAGYLLPRHNTRGVAVRRELPAEATEGDEIEVRLALSCTGLFARYMLQVVDRLPFLDRDDYSVLIARLAGRRPFSYRIRCERRGHHRIGPLYLRSDFPLALHSTGHAVPDSSARIVVLPRRFPLTNVDLTGRSGYPTDGHQIAPASRGHDHYAGIREYRRGDSRRHIHWRASARRGEWIVREYEQLENTELLLVLDSNGAANLGEGRESSFEYAVRIAASVAGCALAQGHRVGLYCQMREQLHWLAPDRGPLHLRRLLEALAAVEADSDRDYGEAIRAAFEHGGRQCRLMLFHTRTGTELPPLLQSVVPGADLPPLQVLFDGPSFAGRSARPADDGHLASRPGLYCVRAGDNLSGIFES